MKKLIVLFLLIALTLSISVIPKNRIQADFEVIAWNSTLVYAGNYALEGVVEFNEEISTVVFQVPNSQYHTLSQGGLVPYVAFYDDTDTLIVSLDWETYFSRDLTAMIDIDLHRFNCDDAVKMEIFIPQTYGVTPSGYVTYIDSGTLWESYVLDPSYRQTYFIYDHTNPADAFIESDYISVPYNSISIFLDMESWEFPYLASAYPPITYKLNNEGGADDSRLELYDDTMTLLDTLFLHDNRAIIDTLVPSTFQFFDLDGVGYSNTDVEYVKLYIDIVNINSFDSIDYANRNTFMRFSEEAITVNFYNQGSLHNTTYTNLGRIPLIPSDPADIGSLTFDKWVDENGREYEYTALTEDMVTNGVANFYAIYVFTGQDINVGADNPTLETTNSIYMFAYNLGFKTDGGRLLFVIGIVLSFTLFMALTLRLSMGPIVIVDLVIVFFASWLGFVPTIVTAVLFIVLLFTGFKMLGGASSE